MATFHFQVEGVIEVGADDAWAAALELERRLDEEEPQVLEGALFSPMEVGEDGRSRRKRRYALEQIRTLLEADLGGSGGGETDDKPRAL